jgi:2,5-diketo-D-gluconate reductase A
LASACSSSSVNMRRMPQLSQSSVSLSSGNDMPLLGFGTWQLIGNEARNATRCALTAGYRHVDTATVYDNEAEVGQGMADSGADRGEVFLTTKIPPDRAGQELETLQRSLELLQTDYVDLWLIHWPPDEGGVALDTWRACVEARSQGLARDIGVSNYDVAQIDELTSATGVVPAVNQIEWSPLLFDAAILEQHRDRDIVVEGYSALRGGVLDNPTVQKIASDCGKSPAQVVIRWHLQHGVIVIPKSRDPQRIASNAEVDDFELSADDMSELDALGSGS